MNDEIYTFNGKDITMNICIQIRAVVDLIQEHLKVTFEEAMMMFYHSDTYKILQNTENALWAESPEYIADRYFEEADVLGKASII
ncbi:MAG: hypothetical protein HDQ97_02585 [Lachnospiraceae bacterium]|nr:hypothetical protein [Lachnospiraceae bacterium]